jgi:ESCRT-I complex subunit TSG101
VPKEYPKVAPIPYVKPTANMLVREGRHVDKSGMCYHHYRSNWASDQVKRYIKKKARLLKNNQVWVYNLEAYIC